MKCLVSICCVTAILILTSNVLASEYSYKKEAIWERLNRDYSARLEPVWDNNLKYPHAVIRAPLIPPESVVRLRKELAELRTDDGVFVLDLIFSRGENGKAVFFGLLISDDENRKYVCLYQFDRDELEFAKGALAAWNKEKRQ